MAAKITLEAYLHGVDSAARPALDHLRRIVHDARPDLLEEVKWNAPSFSHNGEDRVTLGLDGKGGLRVVLHRGAAVKETAGFAFEDGDRLARWPAPDRGVVQFKSEADLAAKADALARLVRRWVDYNA